MSTSTISIQRLRLRRPDPASCPEALVAGSIDRIFSNVESSLERERERRVAVRVERTRSVSDALDEAGGPGTIFLHQRLAPALGCELDHIAVTASGVWVVGAWYESGARVEVAFHGGSYGGDRERLLVRGRDKTQLVKCLSARIEAVRDALMFDDVPVRGMLCFLDAQLPTIWTPAIQGFPLGDLDLARKQLQVEGPLGGDDRLRISRTLADAFPAA
jgi:hypothetical protein